MALNEFKSPVQQKRQQVLRAFCPNIYCAKSFGFRFPANGELNNVFDFTYELNKQYHIEISQEKNSYGEAVYKIMINGETFHEVINTTPSHFDNARVYFSDDHRDTFGSYGSIANLRISSVLSKLI